MRFATGHGADPNLSAFLAGPIVIVPVMATDKVQGELFAAPEPPEGTRVVNDRSLIRTRDGRRLVIVSGVLLWQYMVGDRMAEAHAMVSLVEQAWADQNDVARGVRLRSADAAALPATF